MANAAIQVPGELKHKPLLKELTDRQKEILDLIVKYITEHGIFPTYRELGRDAGIGSLNGVSEALAALFKKGWLRRDSRHTARSYTLSLAASDLCPSLYNNPEVMFLKKQKNYMRLKKLDTFIRDFPDNILTDLNECTTPQEGALLVMNLVDDIVCGDY